MSGISTLTMSGKYLLIDVYAQGCVQDVNLVIQNQLVRELASKMKMNIALVFIFEISSQNN